MAGKTGTAEVVGKADNSLFAAFGPNPNPEYVGCGDHGGIGLRGIGGRSRRAPGAGTHCHRLGACGADYRRSRRPERAS